MRKIKLSNCDEHAFVDDSDWEYLIGHTWRKNAQGYAVRREYKRISKGVRQAKDVRMHRQIMGEPEGMEVDHKDSNGLDNRRRNLRVCTHKENMANRSKQVNNKSGYKGVSWSKQNKKWYAWITINGRTKSLGHYVNIVDAVKAYNKAAPEVFGEFARLNTL